MCMTKDVGTHGNLFGGNMMGWLDEAGAIFARSETAEEQVVTLKFSEIVFKRPVRVGEIINFYACDIETGRTSISFDIIGFVKDDTVVRTRCIFVAIDERGIPKDIEK